MVEITKGVGKVVVQELHGILKLVWVCKVLLDKVVDEVADMADRADFTDVTLVREDTEDITDVTLGMLIIV